MKKLQLAILILVVITLFGLADYFVNIPGGIKNPLPLLPGKTQENTPELEDYPNITKQVLDMSGLNQKFTIEKRTRSTELFENFDLSDLTNIGIFKNTIIQVGVLTQLPIYVYEIHGPVGQGSINYLNIKLAMINQLGSATGINETGGYGYNSLFYNDDKSPTVGFLLSQVGDTVLGFKYAKDSTEAFDFVKSLINNYMSQVTNNS